MKPLHYISLLLLVAHCSSGAFAQQNTPRTSHEISVYGGGGISTLYYQLSTGDRSSELGGLFGLGYSYFFSPQWTIATGVELSFYNTKAALTSFSDNYGTYDDENEFFDFRYTINTYRERQRAVLLNIPVMLQYHPGRFYAALGFKLGIPQQTTYTATATDVVAAGYYDDYMPLTAPSFKGFGTFSADRSNDLNFKSVAFMLAAEAGLKWALRPGWTLYTGVYFDYGLHDDINKTQQNVHLAQYSNANPGNFAYNSLVISQHSSNPGTESFTDKLVPLAVGVKIKLAFNPPKRAPKENPAEPMEKPTVPKEKPTVPKEKPTAPKEKSTAPMKIPLVLMDDEDEKYEEEDDDAPVVPTKDLEDQADPVKPRPVARMKFMTLPMPEPGTLPVKPQQPVAQEKAMSPPMPEPEKEPVAPPVKPQPVAPIRAMSLAMPVPIPEKKTTPPPVNPQPVAVKELIAQAKAQIPEKSNKAMSAAQEDGLMPMSVRMFGYRISETALRPNKTRLLDEQIAVLKKYPNLRIIVQGHTCNRGAHKKNFLIGKKRARVVKNYMVKNGIDSRRIRIVSKAGKKPWVPNNSEKNRRKNRRVEIKIVAKQTKQAKQAKQR